MLIKIRGRLFFLSDLVGYSVYWLALIVLGSLLSFYTDMDSLPLEQLILPVMLLVVLPAGLMSTFAVFLVHEFEDWRNDWKE